jgi:uncharacterized damage-inducible protein DinB
MDTAATMQTASTVRDQLPWVTMTFDVMDQVCALIPDELLDWRPVDPSGRFNFSLGEIAMHTADARRMFARQLSGSDSAAGYWADEPDEAGVWSFKAGATRAQILESLESARAELGTYLDWSVERLLETTDGTRASFEKNLERLREKAPEQVDAALRRGPASVMRVLMAAAVHEAGHRGTLYTLLRQHGVNLPSSE